MHFFLIRYCKIKINDVFLHHKIKTTTKTHNIMTQQEFEHRVKMTVSSAEFDAINEVYMNCDLDKDEFCKEWVKMNKSRVARAEAERKAEEQKQQDIERAFNLYNKLEEGIQNFSLAIVRLTDKEQEFVERIGIQMQEFSNYYGCTEFKTTQTVSYELGKFCGAIA